MRKRIFILFLCLIVLIAGFAIVGRNRYKAAPSAKYIFKGGVIGAPIVGTASSANYKLTSGAIDLALENEEVR